MNEFVLNLNVEAEVVLTTKGANILNDYHNVLFRFNPNMHPKIYNAGDFYRGMLWEIMNIFGSSIHMGIDSLFEGNNIKIIK